MAIRNRLENYVVRSTTELLGDLPESRQSELGDLLGQMEGRGESFVEAETRIEELLARLEQRSTAVTALEAELSELKARVARLKHELEERDRQANDRIEAERVRAAEREASSAKSSSRSSSAAPPSRKEPGSAHRCRTTPARSAPKHLLGNS